MPIDALSLSKEMYRTLHTHTHTRTHARTQMDEKLLSENATLSEGARQAILLRICEKKMLQFASLYGWQIRLAVEKVLASRRQQAPSKTGGAEKQTVHQSEGAGIVEGQAKEGEVESKGEREEGKRELEEEEGEDDGKTEMEEEE